MNRQDGTISVYARKLILEDEEIEDPESFDEEDLLPLVISSVKFDRIGDPSSLDDLME